MKKIFKNILSLILHPFSAIIIGGILGGIFSYIDLVVIAYIFYAYPGIILFRLMLLVAIRDIKGIIETSKYKKNKGLLTGTIKDSLGKPVHLMSVRVKNSDGSVGKSYGGRYMNITNKNGQFTIHRLYNGDYIVEFYNKKVFVEVPFSITDENKEVRIDYQFK